VQRVAEILTTHKDHGIRLPSLRKHPSGDEDERQEPTAEEKEDAEAMSTAVAVRDTQDVKVAKLFARLSV